MGVTMQIRDFRFETLHVFLLLILRDRFNWNKSVGVAAAAGVG